MGRLKAKTIFPVFKNDGQPLFKPSTSQKNAIASLLLKIEKEQLVLIENKCLCGNEHPKEDIIIAEKDRYGIPVSNVLCSRCGLVRSSVVFNKPSNDEFYKHYYRSIYSGRGLLSKEYFNNQVKRGENYLNIIENIISISKIENVVEIGCGAGGILFPFQRIGKNIIGYDFDKEYLDLGISKGLNLIYGDYNLYLKDEFADIIILSHVMEHFLNPIEEMNEIIEKIRPEKYLLVEVPGLFYTNNGTYNPLINFQNAHVFGFYYKKYLEVFFTKLGLNVLYGNERCTFLCQRPKEWKRLEINSIYQDELKDYPQKNLKYIIECYRKWRLRYFDIHRLVNIFKTIAINMIKNYFSKWKVIK